MPTPDKPVFQTPNPAELKQKAQTDPIQAKYPDMGEANVFDEAQQSDDQAKNLDADQQPLEAPSSSQVINANISGH